MKNKGNILVVDDAELNREVLVAILEDDYVCHQAENGTKAIEMLRERRNYYNLVLLDLIMPDMDGFQVLQYMQDYGILDETPVIVITAESEEENILKAYAMGASDLFAKPFVPRIVKRKIDNALFSAKQKHTDLLTGGYNRVTFLKEVEKFLEGESDITKYAMFYFDIKNIKAFNEMFGTEEGDKMLRGFYRKLVGGKLKPIITSRLGSDHYACLVHVDNIDLAYVAERMTTSYEIKQQKIRMYARFGVYYLEEGKQTASQMIDKAKLAKQSVKNVMTKPYEIYHPAMSEKYIGQAEALAEFENGIENGEFVVFYQPVIEASSGKLASAEALVRWEHPKKGLLTPGAFIPALERSGYITRLDKYMLENVKKRLNESVEKGFPALPTSVNLSWMDFYDEKMRDSIFELINQEDGSKGKVRLEVTETSYAAMEQNNRNLFDELRTLGVKILLDDFGNGYSSFGMIEKYDFDILKLDMSFVRKIETNVKSRVIIKKMIEFCHEIGIKVIAEGAETKEQVDFLKENFCDYIQGYYYSKPLSTKDFIEFARKYDCEGMICESIS